MPRNDHITPSSGRIGGREWNDVWFTRSAHELHFHAQVQRTSIMKGEDTEGTIGNI